MLERLLNSVEFTESRPKVGGKRTESCHRMQTAMGVVVKVQWKGMR